MRGSKEVLTNRNTIVLFLFPSNFCIRILFNFSRGEIENNACAEFWKDNNSIMAFMKKAYHLLSLKVKEVSRYVLLQI